VRLQRVPRLGCRVGVPCCAQSFKPRCPTCASAAPPAAQGLQPQRHRSAATAAGRPAARPLAHLFLRVLDAERHGPEAADCDWEGRVWVMAGMPNNSRGSRTTPPRRRTGDAEVRVPERHPVGGFRGARGHGACAPHIGGVAAARRQPRRGGAAALGSRRRELHRAGDHAWVRVGVGRACFCAAAGFPGRSSQTDECCCCF
jgi:hypothetical protein